MNENFGLSDFILEDLKAVLRRFKAVQSASIFGSRAKGDYKNYSDIDIAVHAPKMTEQDFTRLSFEMRALPIIFKIDIVHLEHLANQALVTKIKSEEKEFYHVGII